MERPPPGLVANASALIDASPAAVWDALTNPEEIREYMFGAIGVSEWTVGSRILWQGKGRGATSRTTA